MWKVREQTVTGDIAKTANVREGAVRVFAGRLVLALLVGFAPFGQSNAGSFADGASAYKRGDFQVAYESWLPDAYRGIAEAQFNIGSLFANGQGVEQDFDEALKWYRLAAEQSFARAENAIGHLYERGQGVPKDLIAAVDWYRRARLHGSQLAERNLTGDGEVARWLAQLNAANSGDSEAQVATAWTFMRGQSVTPNYVEAVRLFREAASQGNAEALYGLGFSARTGHGLPQIDREAARYYQLSADKGFAEAQFQLGLMYRNGWGVAKDLDRAATLLRAASHQSHALAAVSLQKVLAEIALLRETPPATSTPVEPTPLELKTELATTGTADEQFELGRTFEAGEHVAQDFAEAAKWYRLAADQGHSDSQVSLGDLYYTGSGVQRDYTAAVGWYRLAARQGNTKAQFKLGFMFNLGLGVPQDFEQAIEWYQLAADQGDVDARERLADLVSKREAETATEVALEDSAGTFLVPVVVNGALTLKFTVDSGASDVTIPADVFSTLVRTGTIEQSDMFEVVTYTLADGTAKDFQTFRIRSLKVGDHLLENVTGSVADANGMLLLGQSFLRNFKSWSIDNTRNMLVLVPR